MRKLTALLVCMLCIIVSMYAQQQKTTVTGKVTDDKGGAIAGASVKEKNSRNGTVADNDGMFRIVVPAGSKLVISATGFSTTEVNAGPSLTVVLVLENKSLTEVVVTAQGIRRRPKELGYSVAKLSTPDFTVGRSPQIAASLAGKVSGLVVINANNSVDPAVKITLRGYRSMSGNNDALIVIDGLPQAPGSSTMLNLLNPNDIENITVLKGGQAATLYGSQGINGALVITTKRGQKGKTKITYSSSYNVEHINIMAKFQEKYGSGSHYAAGFGTAAWKPNYLDRMKDNWRSYENQQFGDAYDGSMRPAGRTLIDSSFLNLPYSAIKDVRKDIWDVGFTLNNQVAFSGGNDNSAFYFSAENNKTEGIVPGDNVNRTGTRFSASHEAGRVKIGFSAAYVQAKYDRSTFNFYNESINQSAHIPLPDMRDWRNNKFANPNAYYNDYYTNPYFRLDNERIKYQDANFSGNAELTIKILPWLNAFNRFAVMQNTRTQKATVGQYFHSVWAKSGAYVPTGWDKGDGKGITRAATDFQGGVADASNTENLVSNDMQLQFAKNFNDVSLKGLAGFAMYDRKTKSVTTSSSSIVVPDVFNVSNRRGENAGGESNTEERKFGYYGDVLAGWKDMIFLHSSIRFDATSRFYKPYRAKDQYSYLYSGVDVSAVVTELFPGIKGSILNFAKLRAGYNKNGNDNLPLYGLDLTFGNAAGFPYGNTVGISVGNTLPDQDLKPEFVNSFEVGGEFQLWKNRVNLDIAYYNQKSKNQILTVAIPASTGFGNLLLNVGSTKNWGYEADVKVQLIKKQKLNWDVSVRGSINENKVVKLYPGITEFFVSGYSYAGTYVMQNSVFPVLKSTSYVRDSAGHIVVSAASGYPLTTGPLKNLGRVTPKYMLGSGTTISYGNFTLTTNWEYRGGCVMFSDLARQMTFTGSGKWTEQREPFIVPNSVFPDASNPGKYVLNTTVKTREAEYDYWVTYYRLISENFTVPAWFIKMRDINLSYNFSGKILDKTKIFSSATIAVYGRNLITIVDKKNQFADPEFSFTTGNGVGINNTDQTPPVRQYGINLNLSFK